MKLMVFSHGKGVAGNTGGIVERGVRGALPRACMTVSPCEAILLPFAGVAAPACRPVPMRRREECLGKPLLHPCAKGNPLAGAGQAKSAPAGSRQGNGDPIVVTLQLHCLVSYEGSASWNRRLSSSTSASRSLGSARLTSRATLPESHSLMKPICACPDLIRY